LHIALVCSENLNHLLSSGNVTIVQFACRSLDITTAQIFRMLILLSPRRFRTLGI